MSDDAAVGSQDLQFERVTSGSGPASGSPAAECSGCHTSITTEYYDINGQPFCDRCRKAVELFAETPRGVGRFLIAGAFGFGAGLVGAADLLRGYRDRASRDRHRRHPNRIHGRLRRAQGCWRTRRPALSDSRRRAHLRVSRARLHADGHPRPSSTPHRLDGGQQQGACPPAPLTKTDKAAAPPSAGKFFLALALLAGFVAALPVLVVIGLFPSGLIRRVDHLHRDETSLEDDRSAASRDVGALPRGGPVHSRFRVTPTEFRNAAPNCRPARWPARPARLVDPRR